ncbi:hypothetical protein QTO34_003815 [Cnephaeus nilssonii]|uniref:Uncharacterized protein n=1 Tax=Cnephaeus nilssonii TaxID=3371016 RepID=A0AA40LK82_CNENI|nr:hypothetical protein QTO34_003815 [Eptesicus nilssonii]
MVGSRRPRSVGTQLVEWEWETKIIFWSSGKIRKGFIGISGSLFLLLLPLTFTHTALKDIYFLAESSEAALVRVSQKLECISFDGSYWCVSTKQQNKTTEQLVAMMCADHQGAHVEHGRRQLRRMVEQHQFSSGHPRIGAPFPLASSAIGHPEFLQCCFLWPQLDQSSSSAVSSGYPLIGAPPASAIGHPEFLLEFLLWVADRAGGALIGGWPEETVLEELGVADSARGKLLLAENWCRQPRNQPPEFCHQRLPLAPWVLPQLRPLGTAGGKGAGTRESAQSATPSPAPSLPTAQSATDAVDADMAKISDEHFIP